MTEEGYADKSGYGYMIDGRKGTGRIYKAGLTFSSDENRQITRQLFQSMARMSDRFGIIVRGYSRKESR